MIKGKAYIFNTMQSDLVKYNGCRVEVLKKLSNDEVDTEDVGEMYEIRIDDETTVQAFADELRPVQYGFICPYINGEIAKVFFEENGQDTMNVDIYDISDVCSILRLYNEGKYGMELGYGAKEAFFIDRRDPRYETFMNAEYAVLADEDEEFSKKINGILEKMIPKVLLEINNAMCDYIECNYGNEIQEPSYNLEGLVWTIATRLGIDTDVCTDNK